MQYGSDTKTSAPRLKVVPKNGISQVDGSSEDKPRSKLDPPKAPLSRPEASFEHTGQTETDPTPASVRAKPHPVEGQKPASKISTPHASRSTSPANPMGSRAGSPNAFGYPYHQPMQNGFFDHNTPTAIRG